MEVLKISEFDRQMQVELTEVIGKRVKGKFICVLSYSETVGEEKDQLIRGKGITTSNLNRIDPYVTVLMLSGANQASFNAFVQELNRLELPSPPASENNQKDFR